MHHHLRRIVPALTALGIAAAVPVAFASPAQAREAGQCDDASVHYSLDSGQTWSTDEFPGPVSHVVVKLDDTVTPGCDYPVALAAYETEGPTWETSGKQTLVGFATQTLDSKHMEVTLDITGHLPKCFGQIDLYSGDQKFDGDKAPHYPTAIFGPDSNQPKIASWNGGQKCEATPAPSASAPAPVPSASASASVPGKPSPAPSSSAPASPTGKPSAPASPSATKSAPAGTGTPAKPSASASASAPATPVVATGTPVGTPAVKPASTTPSKLASTGTDGTAMTEVAAGGAALVALGAGAVVFTRRRAAQR